MSILTPPLSKRGILKALGQDPSKSDVLTVSTNPDGGLGIRANDASPAISLPIEKSKRLLVQMAGGAIYVRYAFDATWEAVQKILIDKARAAYKNNPVEFGGCNKIPVATADADTATVWGTTVASWYWDGNDIVITFDFHKTSALSTIRLPAVAEGWVVTPIDASGVTLFSPVVDGGQVGVACTAPYGYAQYRVSAA